MKSFTRRWHRHAFTVLAIAAVYFAVYAGSAAEQTLSGEAIYRQGQGRDGRDIGARIGDDGSVRMAGGNVACANCHGQDAQGGSEGWIRPPNVRWSVLTAPQGRLRADGSVRSAYDVISFARALRAGIASDGRPLDSVMPRYDLADDEIRALTLYLQSFERDAAVTPPTLVLLLPHSADGAAQRLLDAWRGCPAPVGTRLPALMVIRYRSLGDTLPQLRDMAASNRLAALFAPYLIGSEEAWRTEGLTDVPLLLPLSLTELGVENRDPAATNALFRLPVLETQVQALLQHTRSAESDQLVHIVHGADTPEAALRRIVQSAQADGWRVSLHTTWLLAGEATAPILVLTGLSPPALSAANRTTRSQTLLVPAMYLRPQAADAWIVQGAQVAVAYPYPPSIAGQTVWVTPEQAWHALGCELLARLPVLPASRADVGQWRQQVLGMPAMQLQGWLRLDGRSNPAQMVSRVHVASWKSAQPHTSKP